MNVKEWMQKNDMNALRFAEMLDIDPTYLYQIIRDPNIASRRLLWRIYRMTGEQIEMFDKIKEKKNVKKR